ncbi:MAG TPA: hypothetical protein PKA20_07550 [Burkholderiaceae bacterium]|mgnify:CR=1 FL=1|nr:hypothetical protein [Burkholderiaceae bacterium]
MKEVTIKPCDAVSGGRCQSCHLPPDVVIDVEPAMEPWLAEAIASISAIRPTAIIGQFDGAGPHAAEPLPQQR